uniref:Uncharacterized protein n=1 Tax=Ixodes ricinus TaxID=34613 RepID=A0A6B0UTY0_IXORI
MFFREGEETASRLLRLAALRERSEGRRKLGLLTSRPILTSISKNTAIHSRYRPTSSAVGIAASRLHLLHCFSEIQISVHHPFKPYLLATIFFTVKLLTLANILSCLITSANPLAHMEPIETFANTVIFFWISYKQSFTSI